LWEAGRFGDLRVVGQYANSYIVCEANRLLVLVDQHAAHERILYEKIRKRPEDHSPPSQGLLLSETVELSPREAETLNTLIPRLNAEGFDIEPFGGKSFVVRAVPTLLIDREIGPILQEIAEKAVEFGVAADPAAIDEVQKILACHGAVRAHQPMSEKEMTALLSELDCCQDPAHCPHGRPTWIEWPQAELEKRFGR
jgi:DNA mismatch repair protein MutL